MSKSAFEKALEKKQREDKRNLQRQLQVEKQIADRQQREANRQVKIESRRIRAASIVNGQPIYGSIRIVDKTAEELIKILCAGYKGEGYSIKRQDVEMPQYMQSDLELEFEKLKQYGLIADYVYYIDGLWEINIIPCLLTYIQDKENALTDEKTKQRAIQIGTINASGGNVVIGDVINSSINVDNSVHKIQEMIEKQGGEDKVELLELLEEFKEILENIEESRHIPKSKGFMNRISAHLDKHGWFYAEMVGLLGTIGMKLLMG